MLAAALAVFLGMLGASSDAQVVVDLRSTARLAHDERLTLAHIAELSGPDAFRWASLEIDMDEPKAAAGSAAASAWTRIGVDRVREAVAARPEVHWGRVLIRGSACDVTRLPPRNPAPPPIPDTAEPSATRTDESDGPTIRTLALERLAVLAGVPPSDLRVEFADQDHGLLNIHTTGRVVQMHPIGKSDRVTMTVRIYEGDRIVRDGTFRCRVAVRREARVVAAPIGRGEPLTEANTVIEPRWMDPFEAIADPARSIGQSARTRLRPGQAVSPGDVEPAVAARKGDLINVDCVAGSIVLRRTMRAAETVRDGELVTLQSLAGKSTARARMNGPGRAVMLADPALGVPVPTYETGGPVGPLAPFARTEPGSSQMAEIPGEPRLGESGAGESISTSGDERLRSVRVGGVVIERTPAPSPGRRTARYVELANRSMEGSPNRK